MPVHTDPWPAGAPAWVDLTVPDLETARAFYGPLLGWEFDVGGPETGGYTQALLGGYHVAGLGEPMGGAQDAEPARWVLYLAVDDVETAADAVRAAGGTVTVDPQDVLDLGRMAVATDPTGVTFGMWQSRTHTGWDVADETGTVAWVEAMTHDQPRAARFYAEVFGHDVNDMSAPGFTYASLRLAGQDVAGLGGYPAGSEGTVPAPAWGVYFAVDDTDAAVARLAGLGGTLLAGPQDSFYGRLAVVAGPFGETFSLISATLAG